MAAPGRAQALAVELANANWFDEAWAHFKAALRKGAPVGRIHLAFFYIRAKRAGKGREAREVILPPLSFGERLGLLTTANLGKILAIL